MKIKYKPWAKGLMYLVEAIVIILSVFPILWVVMSSFKTNGAKEEEGEFEVKV